MIQQQEIRNNRLHVKKIITFNNKIGVVTTLLYFYHNCVTELKIL